MMEADSYSCSEGGRLLEEAASSPLLKGAIQWKCQLGSFGAFSLCIKNLHTTGPEIINSHGLGEIG